jgi:hypothetical protein
MSSAFRDPLKWTPSSVLKLLFDTADGDVYLATPRFPIASRRYATRVWEAAHRKPVRYRGEVTMNSCTDEFSCCGLDDGELPPDKMR